jgi:histidyl-tRNA synthetase
MKRADRANASHAISLGDAELATNTIKLRNLDTGVETTLNQHEIAAHLAAD